MLAMTSRITVFPDGNGASFPARLFPVAPSAYGAEAHSGLAPSVS